MVAPARMENPGWRFDLDMEEGRLTRLLKERGVGIPRSFMAMAEPAEVRHDQWLQIENQGQMGACQGHDLTTCMEVNYYNATGGTVTQLARLFAYLATQKIDGLLGRDQGSTISGGAQLAGEYGVCPEVACPYSDRYPSMGTINSKILTAANYAAGEPFRIKTLIDLKRQPGKPSAAARKWIGGGGAVSIGVSWPLTWDSQFVVRSAGGGGQGGHAVAVIGYLKNGTFIVANSWSRTWGKNGFFFITPDAFDQIVAQRYTAAVALSDMVRPEPRKIVPVKKSSIAKWLQDLRA